MGIWIRSQNRNLLVLASEIEIKSNIAGDDVWADDEVIGEYSSKAEAIQALDMIQEYIAKGRGQMEDYGDGRTIVSDVVFQMPEAGFSEEG